MEYGKLVNGELVTSPAKLVFDNVLYMPPTEAVLKAAGYKKIMRTDYPTDGNIYEQEFTETAKTIKQGWRMTYELTPAERRKRAYETEIIDYEGEAYTVDELQALYYHYAAENGKESICKALKSAITAAKNAIRDKYPDEE